MELWIRSQNKKRLMKVEMVEFDKQIDGPAIIYSHEYILGEYETRARALEVLDEIERLLMPKMIIKNEGTEMYGLDGHIYRTNILSSAKTDIQELSTYVYEMPKE